MSENEEKWKIEKWKKWKNEKKGKMKKKRKMKKNWFTRKILDDFQGLPLLF